MRRLARYRSIEIVDGPSWWPTVACAVGAVFAQISFAPLLAFHDAFPALGCAVVVLYALRAGARRAGLLAILVGALEDVFAGTGGSWTIATTLVALLGGAIVKRVSPDGTLMPALIVGFAVVVRDATFWAVQRFEGYPAGYLTPHLHAALWRGALTALAVLVFLVARGKFVADRTRVERL